MSLKQECFDMIKLITEPLKKNEYDFYDLEMDSIRDFCEKTGEDITYSDCYGCDNYGKDCPYKKSIMVDISFYDVGDCQRNYSFSKNTLLSKGICSIKNRKQLMSEIFKLKKELEGFKDWCAEFGEWYDQYLDYAKEFAQEVREKYFILFGLVRTEILPIIFHTDYNQCKGEIDYTTRGNLHVVEKQNVINVYCCMDNIEETKRTIRHEVLHYMLYIAGLKYKDDVAIFHYLCQEFDANAYKEMNNEEKNLYDLLINAISNMEKVFNEKNIPEESFTSNYMSMLLAIGCENENPLYDELCSAGKKLLNLLEWRDAVGE